MDTNIVLLSLQLVLPAFNDFAQKAQLDVPLPLELSHATKTNVGRNNRGVLMVFDDRYQFNWSSSTGSWGKVSFTDRKLFSSSFDREKMLPWLVRQKSLIGTNEAILITSNCLHRLGYDHREWASTAFVTQYTFSPDPKMPHQPIPIFSVRWFPPNPPMGYEWALFSFEISGLEKRITYFGHGVIDDDQRKISTFNLLSYTNSSATHQPFLK